jgi:predicted  nucleic acid-binding Zn-ribbon protein
MTYRRCQSCATFYDKKLGDCPECGTEAYAYSKPLHSGKVNSNLYDMARSADREAKFERSLRSR